MTDWTNDDERAREQDYKAWSDSVAENLRDMLTNATPEERKNIIALVTCLTPDNPAGVHQKARKVCEEFKVV